MTRFLSPICRSGERCSHICVLQNGKKKQELGVIAGVHAHCVPIGFLVAIWIHFPFVRISFSMDIPFLPGWSFIPVQKISHDPPPTFSSPGKQFLGRVHTCWWEIRDT